MAEPIPVSLHAKLSASSAHRWLACPASIQLSEGVPNQTSEPAAEGTVAHEIAARCLIGGDDATKYLGDKLTADGFEFEVTDEMAEAVQVYLDAVREYQQPDDVVAVECDLSPALQKLHPEFGGTADCVVYRPSDKSLRVFDYKHGAGVLVSVEDNTQLRYYALGALLTSNAPAGQVTSTVVQPRCMPDSQAPVRDETFHATDLLAYAQELVEAAEQAMSDNPPIKAGDHCRWCPAKFKCPELERHQQLVTAQDFDPVIQGVLEPEKLAEALALFPLLEARIKQVREMAYDEACRGNPPPGWKLVEKRAMRKWTDEKAVAERVKGIDDAFAPRKVKTPAQLEKVCKKRDDMEFPEDLVIKQSSGYTLAPESDNRPPAQLVGPDDFQSVEE